MSAPPLGNPPRQDSREEPLKRLLALRADLGREWARAASHDSPTQVSLTREVTAIEAALTEGWPHLTGAWFAQWILDDARELHNADVDPRATCPQCQARLRVRSV